MFATPPILLMLGLLAQAELAPFEPQPVPAAPAPVPEGTSSTVDPDPPAPAEPVLDEPESPIKLGLRAGVDFALSADVTPSVGYDFSPFLQYEVIRWAQKLGLAARGEFSFSRFSKLVTIPADPSQGINEKYQDHRTLSYFDFVALAVATLYLGPILPWFGAGAGMTLTHFSTYEPAYLPGDWNGKRLLIVGAFGIDVKIMSHLQVGLHGEYRGMLNRPSYRLSDGQSIKPLGDRLAVQGAVLYQF